MRRIATLPQAREQIVRHALDALGEDAEKVKEEATLVRNRLVAVNGEINNLVGSLAKLGADAFDLVKEGLARLKGEREQLQGQLKELDAAKAPHDVVRERAAKFVTSWTDIGQLIDDADLTEQRVILQHLVHSLVLTAADKGAKHGTYALRLFPEIGPISPEGDENDRGPNPDAPRKGPGDRAVLTENDVVRQFGEKAPRVGFEPTTRRLTEVGGEVVTPSVPTVAADRAGDMSQNMSQVPADPDLAKVLAAWATLSDAARRTVLSMIVAAECDSGLCYPYRRGCQPGQ